MCEGLEKVLTAVKARLPLVWIVSNEELRVTAALRAYGVGKGVDIRYWSPLSGLTADLKDAVYSVPEARLEGDKTKSQLSVVLQEFWTSYHPASEAGRQGAILVIPDMLDLLNNNPAFARLLREWGQLFRASNCSIVIIDPRPLDRGQFPTLAKEVETVAIPLPDRDLMGKVVAETARRLAMTAEAGGATLKYDVEGLTEACLGLTVDEAQGALRRAAVESHGTEIAVTVVLQHKAEIINSCPALEYYKPQSADSFRGYELLRAYMARMGRALSAEARAIGLEYPRGLFLASAPGCGKTQSAKAAAELWGLPLVRLNVGALFGSLVGESEANWRQAVHIIDAIAPCVVLIDEIDKALGGAGDLDGGTSKRVFGEVLTWLQDRETPAVVIATANDVAALPPELMRKGRFDELFMLNLPSRCERAEIIAYHVRQRKLDLPSSAISALAKVTPGFSGAELEAVIVAARREAFFQDEPLAEAHLIEEAARTRPLSVTRKRELQALEEWGKHHARPASSIEEKVSTTAEAAVSLN